jgi:ATP-binding cassette subfamily B multidrug efflux pump
MANSKMKERLDFLRPYLRRQRTPILIGWIFVLVSTGLDQVSPWMVKVIMDSLQAGKGASSIAYPLLAILAATAAGGLLLYYQRLWVIQSSRKIEYEIRRDFFSGLMIQPKRFFDRNSIGDIMSRTTNDLDRIRDMAGPVILHLARMGCLLIYTAVCIWKLNPRLIWLGLLPSLMMPLLANQFLKRMYGLFGGIQKNLSSLNSFLQDTVSGIQVVKAYGKQTKFSAKLEKTSASLRDSSMKVAYFNSFIWPAIGVLGAIGLVLVAWGGGKMVIRGEMTIGTLSAAILYLLRLQFPLVGLGWVASMIQRANVSIDRLAALRKSFVVEPEGNVNDTLAAEQETIAAKPDAPALKNIELRGLSFAYEGGPPVLQDVSLSIPAGTSLGIVGPTGSGKTTLMQLLCGIYPPPPKTLFLNGMPREEIGDAEWIRYFSYAPQDGFLFSTSIRNNILMGEGPHSSLTAEAAAEWSALSRDLNQFPQGYDSMLGEKGINLSGGQRQRVGLARAMMANAPVLGLDDTLSALDTETETLVLDHIRRRFGGHTLLVISHRYSAVKHCDNIIFLSGGRIVEQGTHAELLSLGGMYANVWEKQKLSSALEME